MGPVATVSEFFLSTINHSPFGHLSVHGRTSRLNPQLAANTMTKSSQGGEPSAERPIAEASALFDDRTGVHPGKKPAAKAPGAAQVDTFELADTRPEDDESLAAPLPQRSREAPKARAAPRGAPTAPIDEASGADADNDFPPVEEVWSRGAEWAPALVRLGIVGGVTLFLVYVLSGNLSLAFLILLLGGAACVLLSYPIVITLERPVRMTPEQAARDFFAALSHHFPHYKRMWLLLSSAGRECRQYGSFAAFTEYWKAQLSALKTGQPSQFTPLDFEVEEFKSEKSGGKPKADATYKISVYVRGKKSDGPKKTYRMESQFVKGPDGMWYLNNGALP
jgi:hypothetical protein